LDTGEMTRVTNHPFGQVWGGAWFPDGRRLAYSHEDRLVLVDLDSGRSTTYPSPRPGHLVRTPAVSPDGQWIMFQVFRDGAWLLDLKTESMTRVLDDASAEEFTWAPDGRRVAFHSRRNGSWGLWIMATR
jgi:Tol biopolymer transport system component